MIERASAGERRLGFRLFVQIFDVVLEQEQIRRAVARDADEVGVEKLDHAGHLFVAAQPDAHRDLHFRSGAQVLHFFEGLLRGFSFGLAHRRAPFRPAGPLLDCIRIPIIAAARDDPQIRFAAAAR